MPIKGDNEVQGMIALKHIRNQYYTHSGRRNNMIIVERKNVGSERFDPSFDSPVKS